MKIGIITFQNAHNYGASLQVYALKKYLLSRGYDVEVINYINKNIEKNYLKKQLNDIRVGGIRSAFKWLKKQISIYKGKKEYLTKWNKFNIFINENIVNTERIYNKNDIDMDMFDFIICGSDQIWNPYLTGGFDDFYFANFKTNAIRLSYAASSGRTDFNEEQKKQFLQLISNFNYISVREKSLAEYIRKEANISVTTVVDPTLLDYNFDDYKNFIYDVPYDNYLLQYTLIDDENLDYFVDKIAAINNFKIIELRYSKRNARKNRIQICNAGVSDFLSLIYHSSFVITNSFHGTIFSILFRKEFYTVKIRTVNSRIESLLDICDLRDRCITSDEQMKKTSYIDYEKVFKKIRLESEKSKLFLNNIIDKEER